MNRQARINREKGNDDEHRRSHYRKHHHERSHVENEAWRKEGQNSKGSQGGGQKKDSGTAKRKSKSQRGAGDTKKDIVLALLRRKEGHDRRYRRGDRVAEPQHSRLYQRKCLEEDGAC